MCLSHTDVPPYRCCCGCPLVVGILVIAICELLGLISAIQIFDVFSIVVQGILVTMFVIAFVQRHNYTIRRSLFQIYLMAFLASIIYGIVYVCTNSIEAVLERVCDALTNDGQRWPNCVNDLEDPIWFFIIVYYVIELVVKLTLTRCLYYFMKEIRPDPCAPGATPYHAMQEPPAPDLQRPINGSPSQVQPRPADATPQGDPTGVQGQTNAMF